jgi:hypothetical protein
LKCGLSFGEKKRDPRQNGLIWPVFKAESETGERERQRNRESGFKERTEAK